MSASGPVRSALEELPRGDDFAFASHALADRLERDGAGLDAVEQVIGFMEDHPAVDFGAPGPLTRFAERFHRRGYDELVVASVRRRPTAHTAWLLRRLVNGELDGPQREALAALLLDAEARLA